MSEPTPEPAGLFDGVLAAGPVRDHTTDTAWLQAMLDVESALAQAEASLGLIPVAHATAIAAAARAEFFDPATLAARSTDIGNPVGALVEALAERAGPAGASVHIGATSQDVLDSAAMLVAYRALGALLADLDRCAAALAALAERHRHTVQAGRTLLQQAPPVTFGFVAAGWLSGVDSAADRLAAVRDHRLAVQLGGAVGTLASLGDHGGAVVAELATRLDLAQPVLPWHTERTRIAELAGALGETCGVVGRVARDIVLLAQTEIGELRETGPRGTGGSSTLPHKENPVAAISASASAQRAPGLVATLHATMIHEHQRAAGSWHAEWLPLRDLLRCTGSAVAWLRISLSRVRVDPDRMLANLDASGGLLLTERITTAMAPAVGRLAAHEAVTACCARARHTDDELPDVLAADPLVGAHLNRAEIVELLDPRGYLGSAELFIDRALTAHRNPAQRRPASHARADATRSSSGDARPPEGSTS